MASGSHEKPLQLRIITCHVGFKSFGFHLELEDLAFQLELEVFSNFWNCLLDVVVVMSCSGCCMCLSRDTQLTKSQKPGNDLAWSATQIRLITWEVEKPATSKETLGPMEDEKSQLSDVQTCGNKFETWFLFVVFWVLV